MVNRTIADRLILFPVRKQAIEEEGKCIYEIQSRRTIISVS